MLERMDKTIKELPDHPQYNADEWPWTLIRDLVRTCNERDEEIKKLIEDGRDKTVRIAVDAIGILERDAELEALRGVLRDNKEAFKRISHEVHYTRETDENDTRIKLTNINSVASTMIDAIDKALAPEPQDGETEYKHKSTPRPSRPRRRCSRRHKGT